MNTRSLPNDGAPTGLACRIAGDHAVAGVCDGCDGDADLVQLPEGGRGPMRAYCRPCLEGDPKALAAVSERGISFFEAFLLHFVTKGCQPRPVASEAAA